MPTLRESFDFLSAEGPAIFGEVGSMLYVGHRADTHPWWHATFAPALRCTRLAVVDLVAANAHTADHVTEEVYVGDVRDLALVPAGFGLVFWDEGPEHMPREEALDMIVRLRGVHGRVLVSCPWGYQPQGSDPTDPEFHHWGPEPADFEGIGMVARTFGRRFETVDGAPRGHGNLIAWTP